LNRAFHGLKSFAIQNKEEKYIVSTMRIQKLRKCFKNAFFFLKEKSSENKIHRRLKKLGQMAGIRRLQLKAFKSWSLFHKIKKNDKVLTQNTKLRMVLHAYKLWRTSYCIEKKIKDYKNDKTKSYIQKCFTILKKRCISKKKVKKAMARFQKNRQPKYIYYPFLLWKNLVFLQKQKSGLKEAIVVKHFVRLQIRIMQEWKNVTQKL
jgi:hypothetical protein